MKKALSILFAAVFLLTAMSGCARAQNYIEPEEFEIYYYPKSTDENVKFAAGTNSMQIIMNTPTAEAGVGNISIYKLSDDSLVAQYDVRINDNIYLKTDKTAQTSTIVILLDDRLMFEAGESYYVTVDEKTFYVDDLSGYSGAVEKGDWVIHVADYGLGCNIHDIPSTYLVGDTIEIPVEVAGEAAQAVLTIYNENLFGAEYRSVSESGTLKLEAKAEGSGQVGVMYLDKDGKWLDSTLFTFTVK